MHKSIRVVETEVTRVGFLINWVIPDMSKMLIRKEEIRAFASGNKLQLASPSIYNSLFSASILTSLLHSYVSIRLFAVELRFKVLIYMYMGYWLSVRSRWRDIGQVIFLRVYGPR